MNSVHLLRKNGFKIRVRHTRLMEWELSNPNLPKQFFPVLRLSARGGSTTVEVTTPRGQTTKAEARCSNKENFNRKRGLYLALDRAVQKIDDSIPDSLKDAIFNKWRV